MTSPMPGPSVTPSSDPLRANGTPIDIAAQQDRKKRLLAIGLVCCAFLCFSVLDATAKWLSPRIGTLETTWARYVSSFLIVSLFLNPWTKPQLATTKHPWLQAFRSVCLFGATILNFMALQYLQLAEAISIVFIQPMLVALLAGPILGEWVGPRRLIAIGIGFLGVLVVTRPGFGGIHWAAFYSVAGVCLYAAYSIATRSLAAYDPPETTMFYSAAAGILILTPIVPFTWSANPDGLTWLMMGVVGIWGGLGHWLLILAYRLAPAPILAPFLYTQIIWMSGLGYLVFGDVPDIWTIAGGAIVISSGLYLLHREHMRKAERVERV